MTLGKRIQAARKRLGKQCTQKAIGDVFGITGQAVSQWERDQEKPDMEKLPALARTLKVPLMWLLEGKGRPPDPEAPEVKFEGLSEVDRETIVDMMESLKRRRERAA